MKLLTILIVGLASFRLTRLITSEYGPGDIFLNFRAWAGVYDLGKDGRPSTFFGKLVYCPMCLGMWISLALLLLPKGKLQNFFISFLAVCGVQITLESIASKLLGD